MNNRDLAAHESAPSYNRGAMFLHWFVAALIFMAGGLGLFLDQISLEARSDWIDVHASFGLVTFGFILMRVLWRLTHPAPLPVAGSSRFASVASKVSHLLLYLLMISLPIAGLIAHVFGGSVIDYGLVKLDFGIEPDEDFSDLVESIHRLLAYLLMAMVALHIGVALWRHFIGREGIFARILPIR